LIFHLLLNPIERAFNLALKTDPESMKRLHAVHGTRFKIVLTDLNLSFIIEAHEHTARIYEEDACVCHVTITGTTLSFIQSFVSGNNSISAKKFDLHMQGNAHTAQAWQQLFSKLDVDWQALLAPALSEQGAYHGIKAFNFIKKQIIKTKDKILQDSSEYLKYEKKLLVPEHLVKHFSKEVTDISHAVDRLEARLLRLERNHHA
jgi:ubiquinone biosynthesis protein UbiJ